jgi:sugar phosphate isomerase/epimerase
VGVTIGSRLGCASSLFSAYSRSEALATIAAAGYTHVDLWASPVLCDHVRVTADDPQAVAEEVRSHGLEVNALSLFARDWEHLARGLEFAARAGMPRVIFHPFGEDFGERIGPYAARAEELGVQVALENHIDCPIDSIGSARWWLDGIGSPAVGLALASVHSLAVGEAFERMLAELGEHAFLVYVWDVPRWSGGVAWMREHWSHLGRDQLPGYGLLDFAAVGELAPDVDASLCAHGTESWSLERLRYELVRSRLYLATCGWPVPLAEAERELVAGD